MENPYRSPAAEDSTASLNNPARAFSGKLLLVFWVISIASVPAIVFVEESIIQHDPKFRTPNGALSIGPLFALIASLFFPGTWLRKFTWFIATIFVLIAVVLVIGITALLTSGLSGIQ